MRDRNLYLFLLLCLIWGATWIALKEGVSTTPPLLFAGTRFTTAGLLLTGVSIARGGRLPPRADWGLLLAVTVLMLTSSYALLFWGAQFIPSGLAAVLEMSLTPVSLLGFALVLKDERFDAGRVAAIALGVAGLVLLFAPTVRLHGDAHVLLGSLAVAGAAVTYSWGAVLSRPLMSRHGSLYIAAFTMTLGGVLLLALFAATSPHPIRIMTTAWTPQAIAGWLFLVCGGSLAGYTIYMHLLKVWGSSRSGAYAFPASVVAVLIGCVVLHERLSLLEVVGMVVLMAAGWLAIRPSRDAQVTASRRSPPSPGAGP